MPWSREDLTRLVELEAHQQGVDPRLAVALAEQESGFDHTARSPKGAYGVFQLMPGTATQLKVNRDDPADNIRGGVQYLRQQLDAFGGDQAKAIAAYNAGPAVVKAYGKVPPYKETQGYVSRIMGKLGPSSAEAATPQAQPQASGMSRLQELEAHLARLEGQAAPQTPSQAPPAQPPTPPEASQGAQTPDTSWTPGMRFQALPSITQLPPEERIQRSKEFEALKPDLQQEFLQSEEPSTAGLSVGGGPAGQPQPVTDPAALLAVGGRAQAASTAKDQQTRVREELAAWEKGAGRPWREGDPRMPSEKKLGVPDEKPLEEGITKPSTMIPLLMPGAGLKLAAGPIKALPSLLQRGARPVVEGLSQTAGWTAGRTAETGEVPSPGEIGKEAAWNVATGGLVEIPGAMRDAKNAVLRSTPGAQILLNQRAVQEAEGLGKRVFNAQDKEVVGKAFDSVAATGEKLDVTPVRDLWNSLTLAEKRVAGAELNKISSTFTDALKTKKLGDWDIGELQHLRSELRIAGTTKRTPETQDLLQSLRSSVDEAIHNGMAKGSLPAAELIEAQKAYRKVMQAEDLQGLVTKYTKDSPNLKWQELNLAALNKDIRGGGTRKARELVKGMDPTERQLLQGELDSLARHYPFVKISSSMARLAEKGGWVTAGGALLHGNLPVAASAALASIVSAAARSPNVMSLFKKSIIEGKGQLAQHHVDALINAIRHENEQAPGTVRVTPQ